METKAEFFKNPAHTAQFAPGQTIFQKNETGNFMCAVLEGEIDIVMHGRVIDTARPGSYFGEMALIEDKPRSAAAVARTAAKVVRVDRERFTALVREDPSFALELMRVMAERLRRLNQKL